MLCPNCGCEDSRVLDTRINKKLAEIRRRRECLSCKGRYTTQEVVLNSFPHVAKKDGRREPFNKAKLRRGIQSACQKRPVSLAQIEHIVEKISCFALKSSKKEVNSKVIGQMLMQELKNLDDVAYVRFASVYRTFEDVNEFVESICYSSQTSQEK